MLDTEYRWKEMVSSLQGSHRLVGKINLPQEHTKWNSGCFELEEPDHGTQAVLILEMRKLRPREGEEVQRKYLVILSETPTGWRIREESLQEEAF